MNVNNQVTIALFYRYVVRDKHGRHGRPFKRVALYHSDKRLTDDELTVLMDYHDQWVNETLNGMVIRYDAYRQTETTSIPKFTLGQTEL